MANTSIGKGSRNEERKPALAPLERTVAGQPIERVIRRLRAAVVGAWWALRRAQKGQREMIELVDRMLRTEEESAATRPDERSSTSEARFGETGGTSTSTVFAAQRRAAGGDGLFKYVVLYALTLVLQPVLAVVLTLGALWVLWACGCGCSCRDVRDFLAKQIGVERVPAITVSSASAAAAQRSAGSETRT